MDVQAELSMGDMKECLQVNADGLRQNEAAALGSIAGLNTMGDPLLC